MEALSEDEDAQKNGVIYINDAKDLTFHQLSIWNFTDVRKAMTCQYGVPLCHQEFNIAGMTWIANALFFFCKALLSAELRGLIVNHSEVKDLADHVSPTSILPAEAGGQVPMSIMIDQWKSVLEERREAILSLDDMVYDIDNSTRSGPEF